MEMKRVWVKTHRKRLLWDILICSFMICSLGGIAGAINATCDSCADCTGKLNGSFDFVLLNASILNHAGSCITFGASNIVFDCNRHTIDGTGTGYGINISSTSPNNITVRNCIITDFERGIYADPAEQNNEKGWWRDFFDDTTNVSNSNNVVLSGGKVRLDLKTNSTSRNCSWVWGFDCGSKTELKNNTFDNCTNAKGNYNHVDEVQLNATTVKIGDKLNITCKFDCDILSINYMRASYYNGTGWKLVGGPWTGGSGIKILSATFTVDNVIGTHWVRCGISSGGDADECLNNGSFYDNDDLNFTVEYRSQGTLASTAVIPSSLTRWNKFYANDDLSGAGTSINYKILGVLNNTVVLCNITETQAEAGYDLSACAAGAESIKLFADLTTTKTLNTPFLLDWNVSWIKEKTTSNLKFTNNIISTCTYGIYFQNIDNSIIENNNLSSDTYGLYIDASSNSNKINNNIMCSNKNYDIINNQSDSGSNTGEKNTCDNTVNWNDEGKTGCTHKCSHLSTCSDGTPYGNCSVTKPFYCHDNGSLISICGLCGCYAGLQCNTTTGACYTPNCTPEGQSHAVVPGAPSCCPGLVNVGCSAPGPGLGNCIQCVGASICTKCGDGICGLGENKCNCPQDCTPPNGTTISVIAPSTVYVGGSFTAKIVLSNVSDFAGAQFNLTFDPSVVRVSEHSLGNMTGSGAIITNNTNNVAGRDTVIINNNVNPSTGLGSIVLITFKVVSLEGSSTDLNLSNVLLSNYIPEQIKLDSVNNAKVQVAASQQTCSDGTPYNKCSSTQPKYCSNGNLINNCNLCNCSTGLCNATSGACYTTNLTCSDGTPYGQCSVMKPFYCDNGSLDSNCGLCGCPSGHNCNSTFGLCYSPQEVIVPAKKIVLSNEYPICVCQKAVNALDAQNQLDFWLAQPCLCLDENRNFYFEDVCTASKAWGYYWAFTWHNLCVNFPKISTGNPWTMNTTQILELEGEKIEII